MEPRYEIELIEAALTTPVEIVEVSDDRKLDHVRIDCKIESDEISTSAFGLIYTLSVLSFRDARPAGYTENQYDETDNWQAIDMLRNLEFNEVGLCFYADYVRGRRMKTTIIVRDNGSISLETSGRGDAATRWVATVQGKKVMSVIKGGKA